jgi:signal peptidase I
MFPYLKEGDIVFFKKYKKNKSILKNQQIVIFNHPIKNINLIKRINSVNQNNVEVIGDNIELAQAEELMSYVEKIHSIFWASKGRSDAFVKAS